MWLERWSRHTLAFALLMHAGDSQDLQILASHETSGLDGLTTVLALCICRGSCMAPHVRSVGDDLIVTFSHLDLYSMNFYIA